MEEKKKKLSAENLELTVINYVILYKALFHIIRELYCDKATYVSTIRAKSK